MALGHWDMPFDASSGSVTAAYSGLTQPRQEPASSTTLWLGADGQPAT